MENQPMPEIQTPKTASKTFWIIVAIVAAAALIIVVILRQFVQIPAPEAPAPLAVPEVEAPAPPAAPVEDTTTSIQQDLEAIDLGDLEQEFKQIDTEAEGL